ncbi:MAG TPA: dienelactone hydrolase family protein [Steroidobacteraceae bacterium]|jgi:dienelactone hydrolase
MQVEELKYYSNGKEFKGVLAFDETDTAPRPGVLVMPDGWGLAEFTVDQAKRLVGLGYVALAADLYGNGLNARDADHGRQLVGTMTADANLMRSTAKAGMDALAASARVDARRLAAIGFCVGGAVVLELARSGYDCAGVVSFHGLLSTKLPAKAGDLRAKLLVCTGGSDPLIPLDHVVAFQGEMTAAQADCQIVVYTGAQHSFTKPTAAALPGMKYEPGSARRAWKSMAAFLAEAFGAG